VRVPRNLQDDKVRDGVPKYGWHRAQHGQDPCAEVGQHAQLVDLAFDELLFRKRQQLRFTLAGLLRGKYNRDTFADARGSESSSRGARKRIFSTGTDIVDTHSCGVTLAACAHGADDADVVGVAVLEERDFAVNVVNSVDDVVGFSNTATPAVEEPLGFFNGEDFVEAFPLHPGCHGFQALSDALDFWSAYVCEGGNGMSV